MTDCWISFRIHNDAGYEQRYDALVAAMQSNAKKYWAETTSFMAIRTDLDIDSMGSKLVAALNNRDLLIVREIGVNSTRYYGVLKDDDFFEFFPNAKKL